MIDENAHLHPFSLYGHFLVASSIVAVGFDANPIDCDCFGNDGSCKLVSGAMRNFGFATPAIRFSSICKWMGSIHTDKFH